MQVEVVFIEVSALRLSFIGTANLMNREICLWIIGNFQLVVVNVLVKRSWLFTSTKNDKVKVCDWWTKNDSSKHWHFLFAIYCQTHGRSHTTNRILLGNYRILLLLLLHWFEEEVCCWRKNGTNWINWDWLLSFGWRARKKTVYLTFIWPWSCLWINCSSTM